jgi:hypothetical protein
MPFHSRPPAVGCSGSECRSQAAEMESSAAGKSVRRPLQCVRTTYRDALGTPPDRLTFQIDETNTREAIATATPRGRKVVTRDGRKAHSDEQLMRVESQDEAMLTGKSKQFVRSRLTNAEHEQTRSREMEECVWRAQTAKSAMTLTNCLSAGLESISENFTYEPLVREFNAANPCVPQ